MRPVLISVSKAPSQQCATDASPAIWNHTVLLATRYRRTRPCLIIWEKGQTLKTCIVYVQTSVWQFVVSCMSTLPS